MSNKGVDALPSWVKALVDPQSLERLRNKQLKQHHQYAIEQLIKNQEQWSELKKTSGSPISLKQKALAAIYGITIVKDNFSAGHEIEWIQLLKSIDKKDDDPSHQNRDTFYQILQNTTLNQASTQLDAEVVAQTENSQHKVKMNIDPEFSNAILEELTTSQSQSLIVEIADDKNQKNSMGLVILQGQNGIWLHDPKLGCSFCCGNNNIEDFKDFFAQHLKTNYPDCNAAFISHPGIQSKDEHDLKTKETDTSETRVRPDLAQFNTRQHADKISAHPKASAKLQETQENKPTSPGTKKKI